MTYVDTFMTELITVGTNIREHEDTGRWRTWARTDSAPGGAGRTSWVHTRSAREKPNLPRECAMRRLDFEPGKRTGSGLPASPKQASG